jgi:nucleoside phosphorylase
MSNPDDYTVGWICAIETEYTAAQTFFDNEHHPPARLPVYDTNHYTLGNIVGHNVVMAVLPDGEYGTDSAASVITNMRNSFPNIKVGLMVGIGGGAPTEKNDIRLGDIVINSPKDGSAGVYQYDYGKTIQGKGFVHTGFLNQPSTVVRSAVTGLRSKYRRRGHCIESTIESVLQTWPRLANDFSRPSPETDRLYISTFVHTDDLACDTSCVTQIEKIVTRRTRRADHDSPYVHHGIIASGNQLMKDALIRDRYAREKDILCFEMEAAGIMNQFPCLVIRGICDYSDSHKSKDWQGYAAMAAAAYAKDLLTEIRHGRMVSTIAPKPEVVEDVKNRTEPGVPTTITPKTEVVEDVKNRTKPGVPKKSDDEARHGPQLSPAKEESFKHRVVEKSSVQPRLIAVFGQNTCDFISDFIGGNVDLRHSLKPRKSSGKHCIPCPADDRFLPIETDTVNQSKIPFDGQQIILVGMPGFIYTDPSGTVALMLIAEFMKETYEHNALLSGIIWLQPINNIRVDGPDLRNFNMFRKLCGDDGFKNVILATTNWDAAQTQLQTQEFLAREKELSSNLWSNMIEKGSQLRSYKRNNGIAEQMIRELVQHTPIALDIQHELVDEHKQLVDTAAGSYMVEGLKQSHQRYEEELNIFFERMQTSKTVTHSRRASFLLTRNRYRRSKAGRPARLRRNGAKNS